MSCLYHKMHDSLIFGHLAAGLSLNVYIIYVNVFTGVMQGAYFYEGKPRLCVALGSICIASCVASLLSIGCISINRYVYVCHNQVYAKIYTRTSVVLMCVLTWVVGFLLDVPSQVGWSRHTFDTKSKKVLTRAVSICVCWCASEKV